MNDKYLDLLDNTTDWFWEVDINGKYTYTNKMVENILGYNSSEILKMTAFDLMDEKTKKELYQLFNKNIKEQKEVYNLSYKVIKKDGTVKYLELNALPIFNGKTSQVEGFRGISRDITKRMKENHKKKHEFLSKIIDYIPIPIFYKDINGLYLGVNNSWKEMTGFKEEDVLHKTVYDIAPKEIADLYFKQDERVFTLEENPQIYEAEVYNKTQDKRYKVIFNKSAFFNEKGEVEGLIGTIIDKSQITELEEENKKNEKIMIQQSRLSSMGEMIGNIAHQWRQPLSAISTAATGSKLQKELDCLSDTQLYTAMDTINNSAQYLSQTIEDFRGFFDPRNSKIENFKVFEMFEKTLKLVSSNFVNKEIKVIKDIENLTISSYENELIQVLINILNNSRDVLVKLENKQRYIFINIFRNKNDLLIEIKDNAGGIPEDIIDRIFEPYFTTKHKSIGTGIGLYMSMEIAKNHLNGIIKVENETYTYAETKYTGAKFTIEIPL